MNDRQREDGERGSSEGRSPANAGLARRTASAEAEFEDARAQAEAVFARRQAHAEATYQKRTAAPAVVRNGPPPPSDTPRHGTGQVAGDGRGSEVGEPAPGSRTSTGEARGRPTGPPPPPSERYSDPDPVEKRPPGRGTVVNPPHDRGPVDAPPPDRGPVYGAAPGDRPPEDGRPGPTRARQFAVGGLAAGLGMAGMGGHAPEDAPPWGGETPPAHIQRIDAARGFAQAVEKLGEGLGGQAHEKREREATIDAEDAARRERDRRSETRAPDPDDP